jgi:hypothetical protein
MSDAKRDLAYLFSNSELSEETTERLLQHMYKQYEKFSANGDKQLKRELWAEAVFKSYNQIWEIVTPNTTLNSWHTTIADLREAKSSLTGRLDLAQELEDIFREKVKDHTMDIDIVDNTEGVDDMEDDE